MDLLLDTNIFVTYSRSQNLADLIERDYGIFDGKNNLAISTVTLGELDSLIKQLGYGLRRRTRIDNLIGDLFVIDINIQTIIEKNGDIDAYSQGKLENRDLPMSSRNMGKNDLWIAATASVYDMKLVTTDKDFHHLKDIFLNLEYIDLDKYKN